MDLVEKIKILQNHLKVRNFKKVIEGSKVLLNKKSLRCACLGTTLKLPMSEATLIENTIMIVMATLMLIDGL